MANVNGSRGQVSVAQELDSAPRSAASVAAREWERFLGSGVLDEVRGLWVRIIADARDAAENTLNTLSSA